MRIPTHLPPAALGPNAQLVAAMLFFFFTFATSQEALAPSKFTIKRILLPGTKGPVMLDYFAYDRASGRPWVPAGDTGSVDVIDTQTDQVKRLEGFSVAQVELMGKVRTAGPSSVSVGNGVVYIGSRADSRICVIDSHTLKTSTAIPSLLHLQG